MAVPRSSVLKHEIDESTSLEDRWYAVSKLATQAMGEVVLLQPEMATWKLIEVRSEERLAANYLERQFLRNAQEEDQHFASSWLGPTAQRQTMRVVAPVSDPEKLWPPMEWRLDGTVTTMGELLLQFGGTRDLPVAC